MRVQILVKKLVGNTDVASVAKQFHTIDMSTTHAMIKGIFTI